MGLPLITTDTPGCRDVVEDGVNGLRVPARDPAALGRAIVSLLERPDLRRRFGGPLIANSGFSSPTTRAEAVALIEAAHADAVAVGRAVIANPDLVERWAGEHPENEPRTALFYASGPEGYIDYPTLAAG